MSLIKCPKCENVIRELVAEPVSMKNGNGSLKGAAYLCPACRSVLGAGLDPLAVIDETVSRLIAALRQG